MPAAWTASATCRRSPRSTDGSREPPGSRASPLRLRPRPMITAHDLHKSFKTRSGVVNAVDGVSFQAHDGQITGLLGPNGAGKTTTLRMLYTLMNPDRG